MHERATVDGVKSKCDLSEPEHDLLFGQSLSLLERRIHLPSNTTVRQAMDRGQRLAQSAACIGHHRDNAPTSRRISVSVSRLRGIIV